MQVTLNYRPGEEQQVAAVAAAAMSAEEWRSLVALAAAVLMQAEAQAGSHRLVVLPPEVAARMLQDLHLPVG